MRKVGIIAGNGKLPLYFLKEAKQQNIEPYIIGILETIDEKLKANERYFKFNIGEVGRIVKFLIKNDIKEVVLLGKVEKATIFQDLKLDSYGEKILNKLPDRKDETILFGVIAFFRLNGIKVLPQNYLLSSLMFKEKEYTSVKPNFEELKTIKLGVEAAKRLSELDIGQTIVCKDSSVVALEGIEGTDKTIERAGKYAGKNCIIIKMSRPQQDMRVDVPTVGLNTIKKAIEIGARGIVVEANKMLFLDSEDSIRLAEQNNFFIIGVKI